MSTADAGIWDGQTLRLWALDQADLPMRKRPCPDMDQAPEGLALLAGRAATQRPLPCKPLPDALNNPDIPALAQAQPRCVTRGEELAIAGFLAPKPKFDGILCLPGEKTTLWAHVSAEEVVSMRQFLTGRMITATFADGLTLSEQDSFTEALSDTLSRPENAALRLASLHTEATLGEISETEAASRASAALIGAELAATRAYWLGQPVALIGPPSLCAPYRVALESQFVPLIEADSDKMIRAGFQAAKERQTI